MARFFKWLLAAPFILLFLLFAVANRRIVTVAFDPFNGADSANFSISAPLFVVLILAIMVGVLLGGGATWIGQGKHRKAARQNRAEADRWRAQAQMAQPQPPAGAPPPPFNLPHTG